MLAVAAFIVLCGPAAICADDTPFKVFVSIVPQKYFVERVGGGLVDVQVLVQPGHSPATYEPTPRQMAQLSHAEVYFRIGVPFENAFLPKLSRTMKPLRIVDTRRGITLRKMRNRHDHGTMRKLDSEDSHGHTTGDNDHDAHHHREHGNHADNEDNHEEKYGNDPHTWTDPVLVKQQAHTITAALAELYPDGKAVFEKNCEAFAADLDKLDKHLAEALAEVKGRTFMVFHPSWGYFADRYGLKQEAIEIEGKTPSARHLGDIIRRARATGTRILFVQPQFSRRTAAAIARAIGGAVIPIDPLAADYIENMETVAIRIQEALQ